MNGTAPPRWRAVAAGAGLLLAAGCAVAPSAGEISPPAASAPAARSAPSASDLPHARVGKPARSERIRFAPERLVLPGGARAAVKPAETVNGELKVPEHVRHVGWWDGSAYAGDPFGATVIAGHVDSATEGVGFFARLLRVRVGDRVTLTGNGHLARYRVVSVREVAKEALATDSSAFDQYGRHRLVLITCTGAYSRERGGYDRNLVVEAAAVGLAS